MFDFLNSKVFRAISSAIVSIAGVVVLVVPAHTIGFKVAAATIAAGAAHGINVTGQP